MAKLPALNDAEGLVALNATVDGGLVAVSASGSRNSRLPTLRVRVHLHEAGDDWRTVELAGVMITPSKVDLLPDGSLLLVQSRSDRRPFEPVPDNAQVFSASGRALRSFRIGDGVAHLAVDEPGTIWAGYFDEGVYSGDPFSAGGLTRFDEYGRQLWTYWPPSGFDDIADCYALNVGARTTWAYYYTECRLGDGTIMEHGPAVLTPVQKMNLVSTRGSRLYLRTTHSVFVADLAES